MATNRRMASSARQSVTTPSRPSSRPSILVKSGDGTAHRLKNRKYLVDNVESQSKDYVPISAKTRQSFMVTPQENNSSSDSDEHSVDTTDMSDYANSDLTDTELIDSVDCHNTTLRRSMWAFWLLGMCHQMPYFMALAATRDILHLYVPVNRYTGRACILLDWLLLMSEAIPGLTGKFLGMCFPLYPRTRVMLVVLMNITGCLIVRGSDILHKTRFALGLAITCCAGAISEALYLSYSTKYDYSALTTFSSGTGCSYFFSILLYTALRAYGLEVSKIMVLSICFIAVEIGAFFVILKSPCTRLQRPSHHNLAFHVPLVTPLQKLLFVPHVLPFMLPYAIQNFAKYMITRGANKLQIFATKNMPPFVQATAISIAFAFGNMICRTFGNIADQRHLWLLACLQLVNCFAMWTEVKISLLPQLWQALIISFWVGLLCGSSYLNTHYLICKQQPSGTRQFSHSFAVFGEQLALLVALVVVKHLYNNMCQTPVTRDLVRRLLFHYYGDAED